MPIFYLTRYALTDGIREIEAEWGEKYGETSRGAATERAARMELELVKREIGSFANTPRRSRAAQDWLTRAQTGAAEIEAAGRTALSEKPE